MTFLSFLTSVSKPHSQPRPIPAFFPTEWRKKKETRSEQEFLEALDARENEAAAQFLDQGKRYYAFAHEQPAAKGLPNFIQRRLMFTVPGRPQTNSPRFRIRPSRSNDIVTHGIRQPFITRPTLRVTDTIPRYQVNSRAWKPPRDSPRVYRGTTWFSRGEVYNRLKHRGGLSENWRTLGREKRGFCSMNFLELRRIDWPVRWLGCKGDWIDYLGGFGRGEGEFGDG